MLRDEKKEDDDWKSEPICGVKRPEQWISEEATVYSSTYSGKTKSEKYKSVMKIWEKTICSPDQWLNYQIWARAS